MTLLSVQGLRLALGGREILAGVDLAIAAGTVTGLVGASGSGKSLAALAMMGLAPEGAATTNRVPRMVFIRGSGLVRAAVRSAP